MVDNKLDELDWVKIRQDLDDDFITETLYDKLWRKTRENPFVPIGAVATTVALFVGLFSMYQGKGKMQQYMMRARVSAQAFTIVAMVAGFILLPNKEKK